MRPPAPQLPSTLSGVVMGSRSEHRPGAASRSAITRWPQRLNAIRCTGADSRERQGQSASTRVLGWSALLSTKIAVIQRSPLDRAAILSCTASGPSTCSVCEVRSGTIAATCTSRWSAILTRKSKHWPTGSPAWQTDNRHSTHSNRRGSGIRSSLVNTTGSVTHCLVFTAGGPGL